MHNVSVSLPESHCRKGLGLFDEEYKKSEDLQECDLILVRSAKMHDMELLSVR